MSGDAQPRKRRDKRRRKGQVEARRAEEYAEEREILHQLSTQSEPEEEELYPNLKDTDEVIHVYKDANTGGNIVTKIIFFLLMGGIAVMVGLILLEHRGTTDNDHDLSAKETPWSLQFDDWSKLLTVPDVVPDFLKGEQGDHDHHASHSGEEDGHGGEHEEHGHEEDHGHDEPAQDAGGAGWFSFGLPSWGGSTEDAEPAEHEAEEPEVTTSWFSMNYYGGGDEKVEEEPVDDHEEAPVSEEVDSSPLSEEQELEEDDHDLEPEDDREDEENNAEEELDDEENLSRYDDEEPLSEEQFDDEEEQNLSIPEEEEEEDQPESAEVEENEEQNSGEGEDDDDPRGSVFPRRSSIIEEDEAESEEQDEEVETEQENARDASEEELFPEAIEALQREASELIREQKEAERAAAVDEELPEEEDTVVDQPPEDQEEEEETEGMALKFGVGVALVVVAHVVLVKKWNSWAEGNEAQTEGRSSSPAQASHVHPPTPSRTPAPTPEPPKSETPLADWAEEAIKAAEVPEVGGTPPRTPTPELDEEEYEDESEPEEEEEDLSEDLPPINPKIYEELIAKYGKPTPESSDAEASDDGNREYSDGGEVESVGEEESGGELEESEPEEEQRWTNVKKPAEVETGSEDEEEEEEEESDDEPPTRKPPQGGSRSVDEPTAVDDEEMLIRKQLELADDEFNFERLEPALNIYRKVLSSKPQNARALYGVAQVLDRQAEQRKSNVLLQEAIDTYMQLLGLENIPEEIFLSAAKRAINRLRFRGLHMKAVLIHKKLIDRFNDIVEYRNDLAINYLMVNRLSDAENVLLETLDRWPDDPVARSHYGLVLKLSGKSSESIPHLQRGLTPDHPTTRDARLYFHLGDALSRDGKTGEAMKVYKAGVEKGLFRSEYQRSLYNVDHLTAQPWWTLKQTTYEEFFKMLETNWKVIRDEGLSAMKLKGLYQDEAENLRDVGDWKQFQLFARGNKYVENCKKTPVTCKIIGDFPPARGCKRGQSKFSVMEGGTHVWPHCGPTNCRLRAHLGLVVPPGPAIRVADDTRKWVEGKVIIFDDSFEHEVWHNGTALRLVLIVDIWHPGLSPAEKATLSPI